MSYQQVASTPSISHEIEIIEALERDVSFNLGFDIRLFYDLCDLESGNTALAPKGHA